MQDNLFVIRWQHWLTFHPFLPVWVCWNVGANIPRPLPFPQRCTRKEGDAAVLSAAEKARDKYNIIYIYKVALVKKTAGQVVYTTFYKRCYLCIFLGLSVQFVSTSWRWGMARCWRWNRHCTRILQQLLPRLEEHLSSPLCTSSAPYRAKWSHYQFLLCTMSYHLHENAHFLVKVLNR